MDHTPPPDHSMLGRVFDVYQNLRQIARCVREAARQRGVARPRLLELSRLATGLAGFAPEIDVTHFATHRCNTPTLTTPVRLPFADRAFEACLVTDAYEHIAPEQRAGLLAEMVRVTEGVVLLACPMENEIVTRFDKVVFDFIWGKYAERFEPLDQHVHFGLEPLEDVMASLVAAGAEGVLALPDNYVYRWIHQILIYFDLQHRQPYLSVFEPINRVYNERLADCDYREPCYRYLIVAAAAPGFDLARFEAALRARPETPALVAGAEGALIEAFHAVDSRSSDQLRLAAAELAQSRARLQHATAEHAAQQQAQAQRLAALEQSLAAAHAAQIARAAENAAALARLDARCKAVEAEAAVLAAQHAELLARHADLADRYAALSRHHAAYTRSRAGRLVRRLWALRAWLAPTAALTAEP